MRRRSVSRTGLAMTGLIAGLLSLAGGPSWAQEGPGPNPAPARLNGITFPQEVPPGAPAPAPAAGGEQTAEVPGSGPCLTQLQEPPPGCTGAKSIWANVPPVRILPPPGYFTVLPEGPGYYSLYDQLSGNYRQGPPKYGYPRFGGMFNSFFDADFRYLDDPKNQDFDIFDPLHRVHLGDNWLFATGGEFRYRNMNEINSRLTGKTNDYDLVRTRVWGDLWYKDIFRVFVEFIDADSISQNLPPLAIDINRGDLLNAFIDLKLGEIADKPVYFRAGRQELLLGSQRLISPLDWANTRRTFQGLRMFRQGEKFDVDLFYVQPVVPNPTHFDSVSNQQNFAGIYTTYRPKAGQFIDLYYLFLDNTQPALLSGEKTPQPLNVNTFGTRYAGNLDKRFLWDVELDLQTGSRGTQTIGAGAAAVDVGYHFKNLPWNPTVWGCWEFASGNRDPFGHTNSTFNQLFPFGHYYFGFLDLVGRQNIHDISGVAYLYPTPWITLINQYHHFELASRTDALYSAGGAVERRDITGRAGTNVGDEIDFAVNFHLTKHSDILVGYSQLFSGSFINRTGPSLNPELIYAQYSFRW